MKSNMSYVVIFINIGVFLIKNRDHRSSRSTKKITTKFRKIHDPRHSIPLKKFLPESYILPASVI